MFFLLMIQRYAVSSSEDPHKNILIRENKTRDGQKMVKGLRNILYYERLQYANMYNLEERKKRGT